MNKFVFAMLIILCLPAFNTITAGGEADGSTPTNDTNDYHIPPERIECCKNSTEGSTPNNGTDGYQLPLVQGGKLWIILLIVGVVSLILVSGAVLYFCKCYKKTPHPKYHM